MSEDDLELISVGEASIDAEAGELTDDGSSSKRAWLPTAMLAGNLANATLGAGVLGLPYVAREAGLGTALVMLYGVALLTDWTMQMLLECHERVEGNKTYEGLGEAALGRKGLVLVAVGNLAINVGAVVAYLVLIGELLSFPFLMPLLGRYAGKWLSVGAAVLGVPLSLARGRVLALVSAFSVSLVIGFVLLVIVQAAQTEPVNTPLEWVRGGLAPWAAFGVVAFAFACHTNLVPLASVTHSRLDNQTKGEEGLSLNTHLPLCVCVCVCVASRSLASLFSLCPKQKNCVLGGLWLFTWPSHCVLQSTLQLSSADTWS